VPSGQQVASWLICTHHFQRRCGLGIARPAPLPVGPYVRSGYLKTGQTIAELARNCGIAPAGLERMVADYNIHGRKGEDPEFGRGSTLYNRYQGDAGNTPNPCVAPIDRGPFYLSKSLRAVSALSRSQDGRQRAGARRGRCADPRALCCRYRHGERHGRPLPGGVGSTSARR
jgi:hypothetical protein